MGWEGWSVAPATELCWKVCVKLPVVSILWGGKAGEHSGIGALMTILRQTALTARKRLNVGPLPASYAPAAQHCRPGWPALLGRPRQWHMMPSATLALAQTKGTAVRPLSGLGVPRYRQTPHLCPGHECLIGLSQPHPGQRAPTCCQHGVYGESSHSASALSGKCQLTPVCPGRRTIHESSLSSQYLGPVKSAHFTDEKTKALYRSFLQAGAEDCNL